MHKVVVLGAGYAGLPALSRIAKQTYRDEVGLTLVSTRDRFVERPRLHQVATGQRRPDFPLADFLAKGVDLRVRHVKRLDTAARRLEFADGTDSLTYDTLVYAAGSTVDMTTVPGASEHAVTLSGPESALHIAATLTGSPHPRVVVCGGGLTGLELAAEVAEAFSHARVTLVTLGRLGEWLSPKAQTYVADTLRQLGVQVLAGTRVTEVGPTHVERDSGPEVPFDVCLWAGGFRVPSLAADAGLQVDRQNRILTGPTLRSLSDPSVFAIGDAAAVPGPWGDALKMGCRTGGFMAPAAADALVAELTGRRARDFRFRYVHECLSLGRQHHVIQFLDRDGRAKDRVLRGRLATAYKNVVLYAGRYAGKNPGPFPRARRRHVSARLASRDGLTLIEPERRAG